MKKRVLGKQLSRGQGAQKALFRSMVRALVVGGKITTTKSKAAFLKSRLEGVVTTARKQTEASFRSVLATLGNDQSTARVLTGPIAKAFENRNGGFLRIVVLPRRRGDNAQMARIEWTEEINLGIKSKEVNDKSKKVETKKQKNEKIEKIAKKSSTSRKSTKGEKEKK